MRGRPPIRRAAVRSYMRDHDPKSLGQIMRATNTERSQLKRILRALIEAGEINEFYPVLRGQNLA